MRISAFERSGECTAPAATAAAVCAGQVLGSSIAGSPATIGAALAVFAAVFSVGAVFGRNERDAGLRFVCDAVSVAGAAAVFYAAPGLLVF